MQYEKHDFQKNIEGAIKSGENNKVLEILMKEVGQVMARNKQALVEVVKKSGKDISDSISDKDLARIISSGVIAENKTFLNNLVSLLIIENQKFYTVDLAGIGSIVQGAGGIVGGISNAVAAGKTAAANKAAAKEGTKTAKEATEQAKLALAQSSLIAKANAETSKGTLETERFKAETSAKTITNIAIGLGVVVTIGLIGFFVYKSRQTAQAPAN